MMTSTYIYIAINYPTELSIVPATLTDWFLQETMKNCKQSGQIHGWEAF